MYVKIQAPINTKKVRKMPLQPTFSIGDDATEMSPGAWTYSDGVTVVVEMTDDGTLLTARFPGN